MKVKDIEKYIQEDDSDTDDSETDDEKMSINDASILKSHESGNLNRPKEDFLALFAEVWRSEDDYTGELFDNLDYKIKEFKWIMNILEIRTDHWSDCLQYILRKQAKQFARDTFTVEGWTLDQMVEALKDLFETAERKQYLRSVWTKITFNSVENENPTKCKSEVLQILIARLRKCQYALGQEYAANVHIVDCFLRACRHEPELAVAYGNIPKNFEAACAVFHQALEGKTSYQSTASVITDESSQYE